MSDGSIEAMLKAIRQAIGKCTASEREMLEELQCESEGWRMRLEELDEEEELDREEEEEDDAD